MKDKIKANKLREGKTISADQLTAELIVNPKSNKIPVNELLTGNYHDYKLTMLDVAGRLRIARENVNKYVKDQLDRVRINYIMRKDYAGKHCIEDCRLQYLFSKKSLNEFVIEAFRIETKAISIVFDIENDFDVDEKELLKRLGRKDSWQKKISNACKLYNMENAQSSISSVFGDGNLDRNYDKLAIEIENATLHSMASIIESKDEAFKNLNYSQQVYRMLDRVNYLEGNLDITESITGAKKGVRYIFDSNLEERLKLDKNKYLFFSTSERTYNMIRLSLFNQHGLSYNYNNRQNSVEADKKFKSMLFSRVIEYAPLEAVSEQEIAEQED